MRANLERVRERSAHDVAVLAAVKYVPAEELPVLAEAGIELVGENRAQDLVDKRARPRRTCSPGTSSASCRAARSRTWRPRCA